MILFLLDTIGKIYMTYKYSMWYKGTLEKFSGPTLEVVFEKVIEFLKKSNINYSSEDIKKAIKRQSGIATPTKKLGFGEAFNGALAALKFTVGKSTSPTEISRRSEICSSCPMIDTVGGCFSCGMGGKIAKAVNEIRAKKGSTIKIPSEVNTKFCGFCSCAIPLMVVTKVEDFYTESTEVNNKRPDVCWLKETSTNFTNE